MMTTLVGPLMATAGFHAFVLMAHVLLPPVLRCSGYACDWKGQPLRYRLNGPLCIAAVWAGWFALLLYGPAGAASYAARNFWGCLAAANVMGLVGSAWLLWRGLPHAARAFRCLTVDQAELRQRAANGEDVQSSLTPAPPRGLAAHYFFGVEFNPSAAGVDLKMCLYVHGAAALQWNLLSALALRMEEVGSLAAPHLLYAGMLSFFVAEYMCLECMHLYTYDLFCERCGFKICWGCCVFYPFFRYLPLPTVTYRYRCGFKICWGCFVFYPFFYCVGAWPLVAAPRDADVSTRACAGVLLLFALGWVITRGANAQKFVFKRRSKPDQRLQRPWGPLRMEVVPGTSLLCTGFWGMARHVNYLGEILQAVAM